MATSPAGVVRLRSRPQVLLHRAPPADHFFERGTYYGFPDEHIRFTFFSKAAMEFMAEGGPSGPDVITRTTARPPSSRCLLYEIYAHQGMDGCERAHHPTTSSTRASGRENVLWFHRPGSLLYWFLDRLRDDFNPTALNLTRARSPTQLHLDRLTAARLGGAAHRSGYGLGHTLHRFKEKFGGILNGLDYEMWNPEIDSYITAHYTRDTLDRKYANKQALRHRMMLVDTFKPIVAYVGRLDTQKGVHLIRHALFYSLQHGAQFVLLGSSRSSASTTSSGTSSTSSTRTRLPLEIGYDEELAHLIYAGADLIVVPSLFEPCGLTQMIALRYGTVPIVRAVGGLVDTVFDRDYSDKPVEERNGYVFHQATSPASNRPCTAPSALEPSPDEFQQLMRQGMAYDFSWSQPGQDYVSVYEWVRHK